MAGSVTVKINYEYNTSATVKQEAAVKSAQKATDELRKSAASAGTTASKAGNDAAKSWTSFSNVLKLVSFAAISAQMISFTKSIIAITGEFQKFEAVLTNTLGSNSKARLALSEIVKFASQTPFSVNELTASFVKLANQGFIPTTVQLRKLGDLAASTGKSFDMLTEAIIDAQVGEFERLKEFGIRAQKQGDQVTFTFKGVKQQVDFTNESIRNYILSLGEAEGVTGSMAAISETLAGQISNMGDNFDQLLTNLGNYNKGPIGEFFKLFNAGLTKINDMIATANMTWADLAEIPLKRFRDAFTAANDAMKKGEGFERFHILFADLNEAIKSVNEDIETNTSLINYAKAAGDGESETTQKLTRDLEVYKAELKGYLEIKKDVTAAVGSHIEKLKEQQKAEALAMQEELRNRRKQSMDLKIEPPDNAGQEFLEGIRKQIEDLTLHKTNIPVEIPATVVPVITKKDNWDKFEDEWNENWRDFLATGIDQTAEFLMANEQAEIDSLQRRLTQIQNFYDEQIMLAGDNDRAKKELRIKEERETQQIQREIATREWKAKRNSVIINTAAGVAQNLALYPYPYWILPVAFTVAKGVAELSALDKAKPGFKEGVIDLKGPGSETSDSIDAKLSRGESVITARATRNSKGLLEMIQNNKIDDRILKGIDFSGGRVVFNEDRIVRAIEKQSYPKPPDLVKQGREIYEVYEEKKNHKKRIRSKSI